MSPVSPKTHRPMGKGKKHYSRPNTCKRGYDRQWRKVRLAYLQCNPLCEQCLKEGITTPALDVDHIVPLSKGGERLDFDNLQALCRRCHNKKTHGKGNQ